MEHTESETASTQFAKLDTDHFEEIAADIALLAWLGSEKASVMEGNVDIPLDYRHEVAALALLFETIEQIAQKIFHPLPRTRKNAEA